MPPLDPRGLDLQTWANFLVQDYGSDFLPILMDDPDQWQDWAMRVIEAPSFVSVGAPDPSGFPEWMPWAERLVGLTTS